MSDQMDAWTNAARDADDRARESVDKLFSVTQPGVIFGEPVQSDGYTVIPTNEVIVGMGLGYGMGGGTAPKPPNAPEDSESPVGGGGGGGGGGGAHGRPVAVVVISPQGVEVKPVVDATKVAIALFTSLGAMWVALSRMIQQSKKY